MSEESLRTTNDKLMHIARNVDLLDPEQVKNFVSNKNHVNYRIGLIKAYNHFCLCNGIQWTKPKLNPKKGLPRPPTKEQVSQLIAGSSKKYAVIFKLLSETGLSPIECSILKEKDFDYDRKILYITGRKGHLDRTVPVNEELLSLIKLYFIQYKTFPRNQMIGQKFRKYRDLLAKKLRDPKIKSIRAYDLRHYFGTMTYDRTKDILYVKDLMGHTNLETTMVYTKLIHYGDEQYTCRIAKTLQEASQLIEQGFEYVTEMDSSKIFRRRK
jgi:integrase